MDSRPPPEWKNPGSTAPAAFRGLSASTLTGQLSGTACPRPFLNGWSSFPPTERSGPSTPDAPFSTRFRGIQENRIRPLPHYIIAKEREIFAPGPFSRWIDFGDWNKLCNKEHHRLFKSCRKFLKEVKRFIEGETQANYISSHDDPAGIIAATDEEMDQNL